jgi:N4-gp56 family major capsid protein
VKIVQTYQQLNNWYADGTKGTSRASMTGAFNLTTKTVKDAVETLATKNIPRLGETYVAFVHPHQSRKLRDNPEFIEVTKYAAPGNFMLGEIGRLYDTVFIETTQIQKVTNGAGTNYTTDTAVDPASIVYPTGGGYTTPVQQRQVTVTQTATQQSLLETTHSVTLSHFQLNFVTAVFLTSVVSTLLHGTQSTVLV